MANDAAKALSQWIRALAADGAAACGEIPYLHIFHSTARKIKMPQERGSYIYAVLGGSLRLYSPSGTLDYGEGECFISKIDTPDEGIVERFSDEGDFLAFSVDFSVDEAASVAIELEPDFAEKIAASGRVAESAETANGAMFEAILRLLAAEGEAARSAFMLRHVKREIIYHTFCGPCGGEMLAVHAGGADAGEIYAVNDWIKKNFRSPFRVEELAGRRGMSVSQFHRKFRSAVGMGPLQCQKKLRLTEARRLMIDEGKSATEAAMSVGYESLSQFTRDYRKMFGEPPKKSAMSRGIVDKQANL